MLREAVQAPRLKLETPEDFRRRLHGQIGRLVAAALSGTLEVPVIIKVNTPTRAVLKQAIGQETNVANWLRVWAAEAERVGMDGIELIYGANPAKIGDARNAAIPKQVSFPSLEALLRYVGIAAWSNYYAAEKRLRSLENDFGVEVADVARFWQVICAFSMEELIGFRSLLEWREQNPNPKLTERAQTSIGVDTKFVERNRALVTAALTSMGLQPLEVATERPEGFKLHADQAPFLGGAAFWCQPEKLARPDGVKRVLIVENKATFQDLQPTPGTMIVFGSGNAAPAIVDKLSWLADVDVRYWGDMDSYGYMILGRVRQRLPGVHSILMDLDTVEAEWDMGVKEAEEERIDVPRERLTLSEIKACERIQGDWRRIEQERVRDTRILVSAGLVREEIA